MEWIVEAETLSDFIDHGRYTISSKPLVRCSDCRKYRKLGCPMGITVFDAPDPDGYCYLSERSTDERQT